MNNLISLKQAFTAILLAVAMLAGGAVLAEAFKKSNIYLRSAALCEIIMQEGAGLTGLLQSHEKRTAATKFAQAVATAYLDFEMIPYNEVSTFMAVFGSISNEIRLDSFEYRGRTLIISGSAEPGAFRRFVTSLHEKFADIKEAQTGEAFVLELSPESQK